MPLELLPLDADTESSSVSTSGASVFQVNTRGKTDRRTTPDRRQDIRFESDRRSGQDRRPVNGWRRGYEL